VSVVVDLPEFLVYKRTKRTEAWYKYLVVSMLSVVGLPGSGVHSWVATFAEVEGLGDRWHLELEMGQMTNEMDERLHERETRWMTNGMDKR
jgi:hypothetical protein